MATKFQILLNAFRQICGHIYRLEAVTWVLSFPIVQSLTKRCGLTRNGDVPASSKDQRHSHLC